MRGNINHLWSRNEEAHFLPLYIALHAEKGDTWRHKALLNWVKSVLGDFLPLKTTNDMGFIENLVTVKQMPQ